jgi:4-oxalomesaconate tautomerase
MLAAVVPFAIEYGLITPQADTTTARVLTINTQMQCDITVQTPLGPHGRVISYDGETRIDGVPGTSAPITINFLDTAGSVCSGLLPTGQVRDHVTISGSAFETFDLDITCIDNGMPLVLFNARDVDCTGYESVAALNTNLVLKAKLEALRLHCGHLMGLGDVTTKNYPKMTLVAAPRDGGSICTRSFIPHVCHDAIGVLAARSGGGSCCAWARSRSLAQGTRQDMPGGAGGHRPFWLFLGALTLTSPAAAIASAHFLRVVAYMRGLGSSQEPTATPWGAGSGTLRLADRQRARQWVLNPPSPAGHGRLRRPACS